MLDSIKKGNIKHIGTTLLGCFWICRFFIFLHNMEEGTMNVEVIWRGAKLNVEVNSRWTVGELGKKLLELTNVKPDTLKLIVPQTNGKCSRLFAPFSDDNSSLDIQETGIIKGKPVRMMGAFDDEINEVSQNNMKPDLRIAGFEEEEKRLRQLSSYKPQASLKLPEGPYIFCGFRTLEVPGIELNPPPSKALRIMHILVCDPGIIAIMNKHRWRVGIMTELAPVGYVGISPKCILGFNKNHGEEISLRLRTDDLKGFRKYESIKKTLLHELAHMVYSEHDANFLALEKQLTEEAASLDWTKSRSRTVSGREVSNHYEDDVDHLLDATDVGHKLGGGSNSSATARASSVAAAYHRFLSSNTSSLLGLQAQSEFVHVDDAVNESLDDAHDVILKYVRDKQDSEPDLDDNDGLHAEVYMSIDDHDPDKALVGRHKKSHLEPETNDSKIAQSQINDLIKNEPESDGYSNARITNDVDIYTGRSEEPDPDNEVKVQQGSSNSLGMGLVKAESDPDDHMSDSDKIELQRIEEPMAAIYARIQESIKLLRSELTPHMAASVLQSLSKIIRFVMILVMCLVQISIYVLACLALCFLSNVYFYCWNIIEHPDELKFRRIRKANAQFQRNVANYKAAMEVLNTVGFSEDVLDEDGEVESYLVLKRNDPGLLWLAKSSLELFIA